MFKSFMISMKIPKLYVLEIGKCLQMIMKKNMLEYIENTYLNKLLSNIIKLNDFIK